jgi:hypothetical protein
MRECRKPMARARENGETMTTRATNLEGNGGGRGLHRGVGKSRALPGGDPTGAASRRLAAIRFPWPVACRRYAPTGTGPVSSGSGVRPLLSGR